MVKDGLAVLDINLHEIEVEALPTDIESVILTSLPSRKLRQSQALRLKLPTEVTVLTDLDSVVVALGAPQKEEAPLVEEAPAEAEVTGAVPADGEATEGEKPAEGTKPE
jgi:hypothetical protein